MTGLNVNRKTKKVRVKRRVKRVKNKMEIEHDENKKSNGNKTIMEIKNFKPNIGLKDEIFSESFLIKF